MGVLIAAFVVAFVPALLFVLFFRLLDIYEKEPVWVVTLAFLWGAIPAVLIAGIAEVVGITLYSASMNADPQAAQGVLAAVLAPILEETAKAAFLAMLFFFMRRQIDSPLDGLIVGATVGLGFAASENVVYLLGAYGDAGTQGFVVTAILRIGFLGFGHALFTGVTGLGFAYARFGRGAWRFWAPVLGLLGAMSLHAIWNGALVAGQPIITFALHWLALIGMLVLVGVLLGRERKWMRPELEEEVRYGLVQPDEVRRACAVWGRVGTEIAALFTGGWGSRRAKERFYRDLSELALCKHNLRTLGDDPKGVGEMQQLRARLAPDRARAGF